MNLSLCVRTAAVAAVLSLLLSACATTDDVAGPPQCEDSPLVKELPDQVARRESRCRDSIQVWSSEKRGSDQPLDFSGKNKGD
ncbi:hypothetical protein [Stenotrophomonas sp.]|uniref:hypothetical protein n=1 Tax=Stenotrophomonas sp. TaxID=69392 RepID=UPI0028A90E46|nr:hypothetical protein [Stenotrophomonas sp.]